MEKTRDVLDALDRMILKGDSFNTRAEAKAFIAGFDLDSSEKITLINTLYTGQTKDNLAHWERTVNQALESDAPEQKLDLVLSRIIEDATTTPGTRLANQAAYEVSSATAAAATTIDMPDTASLTEPQLDERIAAFSKREEELRSLMIKNIKFFAENPEISADLIDHGTFMPDNKTEFLDSLSTMDNAHLLQTMNDLKMAYGNLDKGNFVALTHKDFAEIDELKSQAVEKIISNDVLMANACSELGVETLSAKDIENKLGGMDADTLRLALTTLDNMEQSSPDVSLETATPTKVAVSHHTAQPLLQNVEPVITPVAGTIISQAPVDMSTSNTDPLAPGEVPNYNLPARYTINPGDTLSEMVNCHYRYAEGIELDSKRIKEITEIVAEANGIKNIHRIKAGDSIVMPSVAELTAELKGHKINTEQWFTPETLKDPGDCNLCNRLDKTIMPPSMK